MGIVSVNIHGIMQTWKYVGRIFPSNSILDPVSTPRNALYDRRTEVSKMETVNYILIWRHASWENCPALILPTAFLSPSQKGIRCSVRLFRDRFSRIVSIIRVNCSAG